MNVFFSSSSLFLSLSIYRQRIAGTYVYLCVRFPFGLFTELNLENRRSKRSEESSRANHRRFLFINVSCVALAFGLNETRVDAFDHLLSMSIDFGK